jgi:hypothetical protein
MTLKYSRDREAFIEVLESANRIKLAYSRRGNALLRL